MHENFLSSLGFLGFIIVPLAFAFGFDLLKSLLLRLFPAPPAAAPAAGANTFSARKPAAARSGPRDLLAEHELAERERARKEAENRPAAADPAPGNVAPLTAADLQDFDYAEFRSADSGQ